MKQLNSPKGNGRLSDNVSDKVGVRKPENTPGKNQTIDTQQTIIYIEWIARFALT